MATCVDRCDLYRFLFLFHSSPSFCMNVFLRFWIWRRVDCIENFQILYNEILIYIILLVIKISSKLAYQLQLSWNAIFFINNPNALDS